MDVVYRRGKATAAEVLEDLADPPSYSAVRATLGILEKKGRLTHRREGKRYLFEPVVARADAARGALKSLLATYFDGAVDTAVAALLEAERDGLKEADYRRLTRLIREAQTRERKP